MDQTRVLVEEPSPERTGRQNLTGSTAIYGYKKFTGSHWDDDGLVIDVERGWLTARQSIAGALATWIARQEIDEPTRADPKTTVGELLIAVAETGEAWLWERLGRLGDPEAVPEPESAGECEPRRSATSVAMETMHDRALEQQRERVFKLTGEWVSVVERTEYDWEGSIPAGLMADLVANVRYCLAKFEGAMDQAARKAGSAEARVDPPAVWQWDERADDIGEDA